MTYTPFCLRSGIRPPLTFSTTCDPAFPAATRLPLSRTLLAEPSGWGTFASRCRMLPRPPSSDPNANSFSPKSTSLPPFATVYSALAPSSFFGYHYADMTATAVPDSRVKLRRLLMLPLYLVHPDVLRAPHVICVRFHFAYAFLTFTLPFRPAVTRNVWPPTH